MVTLTYEATLTALDSNGSRTPISHSGTAVFVPSEDGWRAAALDVTTTLDDA
jgi:hypothetical protein